MNLVRRKSRFFYQRLIPLGVLVVFALLLLSYFNLEFCFRLLWHGRVNYMCNKYRGKGFSGALCEELCTTENLNNFQCPLNEMKSVVFVGVKNEDKYAVKLAEDKDCDLVWEDSEGHPVYPHVDVFLRMVKIHIILTYNVSLDEGMISTFISQKIDGENTDQMDTFWRLFQDNDYMMSKLYEEDCIFPTVLSTCGPYYATEEIDSIYPENDLKHYLMINWPERLKFAMQIMDYLYRLEAIKPEPILLCEIDPQLFGMSADKKLMYRSARHAFTETQIDRGISGGWPCTSDDNCKYHDCIGKCNTDLNLCTGIQQNNNWQVVCSKIFRGSRFSPGLFYTSRTSMKLKSLIDLCSDPSSSPNYHWPNRPLAPNHDLTIQIYNEVQRLYTEVTFAH